MSAAGTAEGQDRLLTPEQLGVVLGRTYSRPHLWRMMRDGRFPKHIQLTPRRRVWSERAVLQWIAAKRAPAASPEADQQAAITRALVGAGATA